MFTQRKYLKQRLGKRTYKLSVESGQYLYGDGLAVQLFDAVTRDPWAVVSINIPSLSLPSSEFVFKTYSENEGLLQLMLAAGFVELTGKTSEGGPICRLLRDSYGPLKGE